MIAKVSVRKIACFLLISFSLLPITRVFPSVAKGLIIVAVFFLSLIFAIGQRRRFSTTHYFALLASFVCLNALIYAGEYRFVQEFDFLSKYLMMMAFALNFILTAYVGSSSITWAKKYLLVLLVVTSFTTLLGLISNPDASRLLASGNTDSNRTIQIMNIGGYGFIYAATIATPWIIYKFREEKKASYIFALVVIGLCIFKSSYTTAILLFICCVGASIFIIKSSGRNKFIRSLLTVLVLGLFALLILTSNIFWELALNIVDGNDILVERIANLRDLFVSKSTEGDISFRGRLYSMSWQGFLNNPILGNIFSSAPTNLGYHSEIIDLLGGCGIVGLIALVITVICVSKQYSFSENVYSQKMKPYFIVAMFALFILSFIDTIIGSLEIATIVAFLYVPEECA